MDDRVEKGRQVVRNMLGEDFLRGMEGHIASGGFGSDAGRLALGSAFGDVWARAGLTPRERSLVTMAILIAMRTPAEYKNHVRAALGNGCSVKDIEETLIQSIPYVGFAIMASSMTAAIEVLKEKKLIDANLRPGGHTDTP